MVLHSPGGAVVTDRRRRQSLPRSARRPASPPPRVVNKVVTGRERPVHSATRWSPHEARDSDVPHTDRTPRSGHEEEHRVTITTSRRIGALALLATIAFGACSNGGASTAPTAAASAAGPTTEASSGTAPSAAAV